MCLLRQPTTLFTITNVLSYLFWPNPGLTGYENPKVTALLIMSAVLVVTFVFLKRWRSRLEDPMKKKLSRSWPSASLWFGIIAAFLTISRAEGISYLSIRFFWIVWIIVLALFLFVQWKQFRARYYRRLPTEKVQDPREKYLPKKK